MYEIKTVQKSGYDVCLVLMPFAVMERPSIGLSILKASLTQANISSRVVYSNLKFVEEIGIKAYDAICKSMSSTLLGEWVFSETVFPGFMPDNDEYFRYINHRIGWFEDVVHSLFGNVTLKELSHMIRRHASAFIEKTARSVLELSPRIVGCSSTFQQHCPSLALLKRIKEIKPDVITLIGGANCEVPMGIVTHRECSWVDFVISGEGDIVLPELCKKLLTTCVGISLEELPPGVIGPVHRENGDSFYAALENSDARARVTDMNDSPIPDYDDYFTDLNSSTFSKWIEPCLPVETSRGCWWGQVSHCSFCGLNGNSLGYRSKKPDRVINEFAYLSERYGINKLAVVDNILDMRYLNTVIPALAQQGKNYDLFYETKANLNRQQLQTMADAGIKWIQPGIESLDDTILKILGKGTTARQNVQLLKWARETGIFITWLLLYEIPGESDDAYLKFSEWLPYISHLQPPRNMAFIQYNRFSPYHLQQEKFNFHISPDRSYSYIYPWDKKSLENFAYYFENYTIHREQINPLHETKLQRPGLQAVQHVFFEWQKSWTHIPYSGRNKGEQPVLVMEDSAGQLEITDTRQCAIQNKFYLDGLTRLVYEECDRACKPESILKTLFSRHGTDYSWEQIEPVVRELCEKKLMLDFDGYFLSLAVQGPLKPLPDIRSRPEGRILNSREVRSKELLKQVQSQMDLYAIDMDYFK